MKTKQVSDFDVEVEVSHQDKPKLLLNINQMTQTAKGKFSTDAATTPHVNVGDSSPK